MLENKAEQMVAMIIGWATAYAMTRVLLPSRSKDFCNRCVSLVHVLVSLSLCCQSIQNWSQPLEGYGAPSTELETRAISVSLAYFMYDFVCCLVELPFNAENLVHHAISITGLSFGYWHSGTETVEYLLLMELSNPFMHARFMLKELNCQDSSLSFLNDVLFALMFSVARVGLGPFVVVTTLKSPSSSVGVKFGALGIQLVSLLWFWKIVRMVVRSTSTKQKDALEGNVSFFT